MVVEPCRCEEGFGLSHDHIFGFDEGGIDMTWRDTGWIRLWVNWKLVAAEFIRGER